MLTQLCSFLNAALWHQDRLVYPNSGVDPAHPDHVTLFPAWHDQGPTVVRGWIDNPHQPKALVYFGGSGENVEHRREVLGRLFGQHTRYLMPHRGTGPNGHLKGREHNLKQDAEALVAVAKQRHGHVDVIGRSLGTSLALHVAVREKVDGLALISPFTSLVDVAAKRYRYFPVRTLLKERHEAWRDATRMGQPVLACLAQQDRVTPRDLWERLACHFPGQGALHLAHDQDHESILDDLPTWQAIADWFEAAVAAKPVTAKPPAVLRVAGLA